MPTRPDAPERVTTTRRTRLGVALLCSLLVLGACGGGSPNDASAGQIGGDSPASGDAGDASGGDDGDSGGDARTGAGGSGDLVALSAWATGAPNVVTPRPGEVTFDVTFSDDTTLVDQAAVIDATGDHRYVLDASAPGAGDLAPGSVLLIPGVALRRVTGARESGGRLEVTTEFAALTDAIVDGDIAWDVGLPAAAPFQTDPDTTPLDVPVGGPLRDGSTLMPAGVGVILPDGTLRQVSWQVTQDNELPLRWTYKDGHNEYLFALGFGDADLDIQVQVKRDLGGRTALAYTATGRVAAPRSAGAIRIRGGELDEAAINQTGMSGQIELEIAAAGAGKAPIDFELPGVWFKYVIPVGPIPVTLGMNARVIGDIEVPAEASAQASARFTFGGDMGFVVSDGSVEAKVTMPDLGVVPEPADSAAMIGNYVNAEFGLAFPQMSISLFDQGVIPRIYPGMILGTRLQWGPVCKSAYVNLVVQGAYDFKILGVNLLQGEKIDLIEPYEVAARGDSCD
jgi:hypothetical protein